MPPLVTAHQLVRGSHFAGELFAAKQETSAALFADLDRAIEGHIAQVLAEEGRADVEAARLARLLFAAGQSVAEGLSDFEEVKTGIEQVVRAVLFEAVGKSKP